MNETSCCSTPSPAFDTVSAVGFDSSSTCVCAGASLFSFPSARWHTIWSISSHVSLPFVCLLWWSFKLSPLHIFNQSIHFLLLLLNFKRSLYVLDKSPSSDVSFANVFSWSMTGLLILLTVSFAEFLILIKFSWSVLSFMEHAFYLVPEKIVPKIKVTYSPVLSSRSCVLYIWVFDPFQMSFSRGCQHLFLHVDLQLFKHHLLKNCLFSICIGFWSVVKNQFCLYECLRLSGLFCWSLCLCHAVSSFCFY